MLPYSVLGPLLRLLPPELAHRLGLLALRSPFIPFTLSKTPSDPFQWDGIHFRNRVGIAAGFDKDALVLPGLERLGVAFVEIGTVLAAPWPGNLERPRLKRLPALKAVWNRLGFPSAGVDVVRQRLAAFPRAKRHGMLVGCNIGPHPGHLKSTEPGTQLRVAAEELCQLTTELHADADFFVLNLSSPNTVGLRQMLTDPRLALDVVEPVCATLRHLDAQASRTAPTPLLLKLPPEDAAGLAWTRQGLACVVEPLLTNGLIAGFVAVNTSTRLTSDLLGRSGGGISGRPLHEMAVNTVKMLRGLVGDRVFILGCGGIAKPEDAVALIDAGANVVELYTGMIYEGPSLPARCAIALKSSMAKERPDAAAPKRDFAVDLIKKRRD